MDHSYEEIRSVCLDLLAGRERANTSAEQYEGLKSLVAEVFLEREDKGSRGSFGGSATLSYQDQDLFLEVFWGLFREGVITLGLNSSNNNFPFFRVSSFGKQLLKGSNVYFFHDVSSYEKQIRTEIPKIDDVTLIYLKEAMQAFRSGCTLSSTVMLGVAGEHTFELLLETVENNSKHAPTFRPAIKERSILPKMNKFKSILDSQISTFPSTIKEDLDNRFTGVLSLIREFRNQSGHPTGKIVDREQVYVLLNLFIPYCKKMHQLIDHFK